MRKKAESVKVAVRCRPISYAEICDGRDSIVIVDNKKAELMIRNLKDDSKESFKTFAFDFAYGPESSQEQIYCDTAYSMVGSAMEGYNDTVLAYGQTGIGKTYTMEGVDDFSDQRGILPRVFEQIFYEVDQHPMTRFLIYTSIIEVYHEMVHDLLSKNPMNKLNIKENAEGLYYAKGLKSIVVKNIHEMKKVMEIGRKNRYVGKTMMSKGSLCSNCIFCIKIETSEINKANTSNYKAAKLSFVDLAGSERQHRIRNIENRFIETTNINKSLMALRNVISSFVDGVSTHIPYKNSNLTKLFQNSLGGNTKTLMIANIDPTSCNYEETISTLRYASMAKNIQNKYKINKNSKDILLKKFQEEISKLRVQLENEGTELTLDQVIIEDQIICQPKIEKVEKIIKNGNKEQIIEIGKKLSQMTKEIKVQTEAKKKEIEVQKKLDEKVKKNLFDEIQKANDEQNLVKEDQLRLIKKLKHIEEKLVQGPQIIENTTRQEQYLQKIKIGLKMKSQQEKQQTKEIAKKSENLNLGQGFSSQQEEIEDKNNKLKKLYSKFQALSDEISYLQYEFQLERQDMAEEIRNLTQQIKLKNAVLTSFIPQEKIMYIERIARWNNKSEMWVLPRLDLSGNKIKDSRV